MEFLKDKTILVTGGTGSFGKNFVKFILDNSQVKKVIVFSRDELKQYQLINSLGNDERLRFFIGDVRDKDRLQRAFHGVDIVVHAAALKQVPLLEYNPFEAVKTNVLGSQNVIEAAIDQNVKKVLLISTDKAAQPVNLYGSTKLCAEKLFVSGNSYSGGQTKFSCVRYGNVIGSRGSIVETLLGNRNKGEQKVYITDERMTRFWITLEQAFALVNFALENMEGGEIYIPKVPSMKVVDLFTALVPDAKREVIGIRPGEKIHEVLLTEQESRHTFELEKYFVIIPEFLDSKSFEKYNKINNKLEEDFRFSSDNNKDWLDKQKFLDFVN